MRLTSGALASSGSGSFQNRLLSGAGTLAWTMTILALGLLTQGLLVSSAAAQRTVFVSAEDDSLEMIELEQYLEVNSSSRDSLMIEIRRYSRMVAEMRDSLKISGDDIHLSEEQRLVIEENIADIS
ncbi:MAG: hypothetical protein KAJ06_12845, partial [Gammaproteobacteria bacterium]|nr:hypothetical protein [Gammaproteobacteria bacterium]